MSRRKGRKQTTSQTILLVLSLIVASSMILSLFLAYLPGPQEPTPTPWPTWTPIPRPTATAMPTPWPTEPLPTATAMPTGEATAPPIGPVLPTPSATPGIGARPTTTSTLPPTVQPTAPPIGPVLPTPSATPGTGVTPTVSATPPAPAAGAQATPAATGFTFAVCGDSRGGADLYRRALAPRFLIHTGDLVNQGTEEQWQEFTQIMADFPLPFYPVPGNHDALDGRLDGYLRYSGAPAAHYSFDYGPVHFTLADSHNGGLTAAELAWLRDDLSATARPLKMVFLHHPPFDPDGSDHIMAFGNESFMALMTEMEVDYVFAGHIHAYARAEREGVVYLYTGGAGAPLYTNGHPQAFHHYLRVTVQEEEVTIEIIKI